MLNQKALGCVLTLWILVKYSDSFAYVVPRRDTNLFVHNFSLFAFILSLITLILTHYTYPRTQGIYEMPCKDCNRLYIGQSNCHVSERVREHKLAAEKGVPCKDCNCSYIGQSNCHVSERVREHKFAAEKGVSISTLAQHVASTGHENVFARTKVLAAKEHLHKLLKSRKGQMLSTSGTIVSDWIHHGSHTTYSAQNTELPTETISPTAHTTLAVTQVLSREAAHVHLIGRQEAPITRHCTKQSEYILNTRAEASVPAESRARRWQRTVCRNVATTQTILLSATNITTRGKQPRRKTVHISPAKTSGLSYICGSH